MGNQPAALIAVRPGEAQRLRRGRLDYERSVRLATRGKALADSTRLILLQLLCDADRALPVGDLALLADREQSGVSRHLGVLYEAGLLDRTHRFRQTQYEINAEGMRLFAALLESDDES